MTCEELRDRLDDWVDGALPTPQAREVEAHLAVCPSCRRDESELRQLLAHAAALPRSVAPSRDLWPAIAGRIERERAWPWRLAWGPVALAAAAALVIALATWAVLRPATGSVHTVEIPARTTPSPVAAESTRIDPALLAAERDYELAANALLAALQARRNELSPETLTIVERNVAVIDVALAEVRRALEVDPANPELSRMLVATHRKKLDALRRVMRLSTDL